MTKDQVTAYDDASKQRALSQEEKVAKNAKPEQLQRKLDQVFTESTGAGSSLLSSEELLQQAMTGSSAVLNGPDGQLNSFADGLLKPDMRESYLQNQESEVLQDSTGSKQVCCTCWLFVLIAGCMPHIGLQICSCWS